MLSVAQSSFFELAVEFSFGGQETNIDEAFSFIHPSFLSSGEELFGLQLHFCGPLERHVNQQLEAAEVLGEIGRGGRRGVEQAALGADVTLPATPEQAGGVCERQLCGSLDAKACCRADALCACGDGGVADDGGSG